MKEGLLDGLSDDGTVRAPALAQAITSAVAIALREQEFGAADHLLNALRALGEDPNAEQAA